MTITTAQNWLPRHCPSWCDGEHQKALDDSDPIEEAQAHSAGGPGAALPELLYAGRPVREYGAGCDFTLKGPAPRSLRWVLGAP